MVSITKEVTVRDGSGADDLFDRAITQTETEGTGRGLFYFDIHIDLFISASSARGEVDLFEEPCPF
jgi:hypothetical protein